jgi:HSP20 family protein
LGSGWVAVCGTEFPKNIRRAVVDWKKLAPWNWFKDEQAHERQSVAGPVGAAGPGLLDFERYFDQALHRFFAGELPAAAAARRDSTRTLLRPVTDIKERKKSYVVQVELPGVDDDDISVAVEERRLVIRAEKRQEQESEDEGYHCIERSYGVAQRVLSLPDDADADAIEARFRRGVLRLEIPKQPVRAEGARRIEVRGD